MIDALDIFRSSRNLEFSSSRVFTTADAVDRIFVSSGFSRCDTLEKKANCSRSAMKADLLDSQMKGDF